MEKLYHFTNTRAAQQIVGNNKFFLSVADAAESDGEINKGKLFYLSLTRTRSNKFADKAHGVMFEIDGRKMRSRFKIVPVDYWGDPKYSESEERLITDKQTVPAVPYITGVHINLERDDDSKYLRDLIITCARNKIPVFAYDNKNDMLSMQPSRRVPLNSEKVMAKSKLGKAYVMRSSRDYLMPWLILLHGAANNRMKEVLQNKDRLLQDTVNDIERSYGSQSDLNQRATQLRNDLMFTKNMDKGDKRVRTATGILMLAKRLGITVAGIPRYIYDSVETARQ